MGKAEVAREETGRSTSRAAGVQVQASREGLVEVTSGRAISQQGLAATCEDPPTEAEAEGGGRDLVWRMSPVERRRRGNALRGGARRHPGGGNTRVGQRGSGYSADAERPSDTEPRLTDSRSSVEPRCKLLRAGVDACQRLSLARGGKASRGKPRSEPDSGNPTVRDRRGARGNVAHGGTVNPRRTYRKGGDGNPPPTGARAPALSRPLVLW